MAKNDTPAANAGTNPAGTGSSSKEQSGKQKKSTASTAGLEVCSTRDGFRRAGLSWSKQPTTVPLSELTKEQIATLKAEPALKVREVEIQADAEDESKDE
ncbi:HI1506-related protein [Herbaspirillum sp. ST 5-3]|uniref:HI1506-related protein n=1 Tax=Oxalobacteraceae TaxID=75682 RepID=UPI0010A354E3|nr:HI1506-related protein [Herbaspirillum sp. ST 5-3]